jgi:hypothetical protein
MEPLFACFDIVLGRVISILPRGGFMFTAVWDIYFLE